MDNVTELNPNRLRTREQICEDLGISERTLYRRIEDNVVETVQTVDGVRYFETHRLPSFAGKSGKSGKEDHGIANLLPSLAKRFEADHEELKVATERIIELTAREAEATARLEERSKQLEDTKAELAELRKSVEKWRVEAEKAGHDVVRWRAKYHVARGRLEMVED
jgi:chromosome segregation ATPase